MKGVVGAAALTVDYSRPAARGRAIWGALVPWNRVWRLGADMATHFTTSADIVIGGTPVGTAVHAIALYIMSLSEKHRPEAERLAREVQRKIEAVIEASLKNGNAKQLN